MNENYWQKRQEQKFLMCEKKVNDYYKGLEKAFEQSKKEIQQILYTFYAKYSKDNGVSFTAAQQMLSNEEIIGLKSFIKLAKENINKYNLELNNASIRARITRYEALEKQIDVILQRLYSIDYRINSEDMLKDVYLDSYYKTWFNIDIYHGLHTEFTQVDAINIEELINYPFNGANFSSRLWRQKDYMLIKLKDSITSMLVTGKNPMQLTKEFANIFDKRKYEAYRLLHTEGAFIAEQGTLEAYKQDDIQKYKILATLDTKTSTICREADGKIFKVEDAVVGTNYPPLHILCRSTTMPYDINELSTRIAKDPITGKNYEVPSNMNYKEWHKEYIENNPKAFLIEKKWKNRFQDKIQYDNYRNILGKEAPKTIDYFLKIKYNNSDEWKLMHGYYKGITKGSLTPLTDYKLYKDIDIQIKNNLIGIKTYNNIDVKSRSIHFIERVVGSTEQRRSGVKIIDIKNTLINPNKVGEIRMVNGDRSLKLYGDNNMVTINPDTGNLIQVNPRKKAK